MEYFIQWVGYPPSERSWEDRDNLDCDALLAAYENKRICQLQNAQKNTDGKIVDMREEVKALEDAVNRAKQLKTQQGKQCESEQQSRQQQDVQVEHEIVEFDHETTDVLPVKHHQVIQTAKIPCKECDCLLSNVYASNRHFANFHAPTSTKTVKQKNPDGGLKRFQCTQCGTWFTRLEGLQKHISRAHIDHSAPVSLCTLCGKKFVSRYNLRDHEQICRRRQLSSNSASETKTSTSSSEKLADNADDNIQ